MPKDLSYLNTPEKLKEREAKRLAASRAACLGRKKIKVCENGHVKPLAYKPCQQCWIDWSIANAQRLKASRRRSMIKNRRAS